MQFINKTLKDKILQSFGPMRLIAFSFLLVICIGTILLMLPISNRLPIPNFIDSLFVATSATCVTGLLPFVALEQYTLFGQIVLIVLMQIGGLGLMTILFLILTLIKKQRLMHKEKQLMANALNKENLIDIPTFIKRICLYTFVFEFLGILLISIRFIPLYGIGEGLFKALFLSVSAFCNAGIDNLSSSSLGIFKTDILINFTVMFLIITGGLGFAVWFDLKDKLIIGKKHNFSFSRIISKLSVHTKLVITATITLILVGTLLILALEFNNPDTLGSLNGFDKIMASLFQSVTLRTAGFSTLNMGLLLDPTKFIMLIFMLIGGSPGGTAGGIKTTTFMLLLLYIFVELKNEQKITIFNRQIPKEIFSRAYLITAFYFLTLILAIIVLSITESLPFLDIVYEAFSAIATVGLSTGITGLLSVMGKIVIIILMFIGRVGPITIVFSFFILKQKRVISGVEYPKGEILIG